MGWKKPVAEKQSHRRLAMYVAIAAGLCMTACLNGQENRYAQNGVAFRYPAGWKITRDESSFTFAGDNQQNPYTFVALEPKDNGNAAIFVWHRKARPGLLCSTVQTEFRRLLIHVDERIISYLDQHDLVEKFDAGTVYTERLNRSLKVPGNEMWVSTVCGPGSDIALVMFGHDLRYATNVREVVLRSLAFQNGR